MLRHLTNRLACRQRHSLLTQTLCRPLSLSLHTADVPAADKHYKHTGPPRRRSGVQKEILQLYKRLLTAARKKDEQTLQKVQTKFRQDAKSVKRFQFQRIEHMIRQGNKYVKLLESDSVKGVVA